MERNVKQSSILQSCQVKYSLFQSNIVLIRQIDGANYEMDGVKHEIDGVNLEINEANNVKQSSTLQST